MNKDMKKKYLFFISQDYSFPILRPLQEVILKRGDEIKWFLYGDEITMDFLHADEERLLEIEDVIDYNPDAVFVPGNVVPSFIPGLKVEVFHGLPSTKAKKNGQLYHYIIREMFDLYCTQGPSSTGKFKELAQKYGSFNVQETGWCKLDPLFPVKSTKNSSEKKSIFFASNFILFSPNKLVISGEGLSPLKELYTVSTDKTFYTRVFVRSRLSVL